MTMESYKNLHLQIVSKCNVHSSDVHVCKAIYLWIRIQNLETNRHTRGSKGSVVHEKKLCKTQEEYKKKLLIFCKNKKEMEKLFSLLWKNKIEMLKNRTRRSVK